MTQIDRGGNKIRTPNHPKNTHTGGPRMPRRRDAHHGPPKDESALQKSQALRDTALRVLGLTRARDPQNEVPWGARLIHDTLTDSDYPGYCSAKNKFSHRSATTVFLDENFPLYTQKGLWYANAETKHIELAAIFVLRRTMFFETTQPTATAAKNGRDLTMHFKKCLMSEGYVWGRKVTEEDGERTTHSLDMAVKAMDLLLDETGYQRPISFGRYTCLTWSRINALIWTTAIWRCKKMYPKATFTLSPHERQGWKGITQHRALDIRQSKEEAETQREKREAEAAHRYLNGEPMNVNRFVFERQPNTTTVQPPWQRTPERQPNTTTVQPPWQRTPERQPNTTTVQPPRQRTPEHLPNIITTISRPILVEKHTAAQTANTTTVTDRKINVVKAKTSILDPSSSEEEDPPDYKEKVLPGTWGLTEYECLKMLDDPPKPKKNFEGRWWSKMKWLHTGETTRFRDYCLHKGVAVEVESYTQWARMAFMGYTGWYFPHGKPPTSSPKLWERRFRLEAMAVNKTLQEETAKLKALPEEIQNHCLELLGKPLADATVAKILETQMLKWRITHPKERSQIEYFVDIQDKLRWEWLAHEGCSQRDAIAADQLMILRESNSLISFNTPPITGVDMRNFRTGHKDEVRHFHYWFYKADLSLVKPHWGTPEEWWAHTYSRPLTSREKKFFNCEQWTTEIIIQNEARQAARKRTREKETREARDKRKAQDARRRRRAKQIRKQKVNQAQHAPRAPRAPRDIDCLPAPKIFLDNNHDQHAHESRARRRRRARRRANDGRR